MVQMLSVTAMLTINSVQVEDQSTSLMLVVLVMRVMCWTVLTAAHHQRHVVTMMMLDYSVKVI